jgi:hypothetical protein
MTTLADIRARVRKDLHDDPEERWSDDQLDRHITRALADVSLAIPRELTADLATTPGSRDLSLAPLAGLIEVEAVEFPAGLFPPARVGFSRWAGTLTIHTERPPAGEDARLYYSAAHTLDGAGSTLPPEFEDILALGAGAYAALELASFTADRLNIGGPAVPERHAAWGRAAMTAFRQLLGQHGRRNAVRQRRLYTPA